jgi:hypothetical protein
MGREQDLFDRLPGRHVIVDQKKTPGMARRHSGVGERRNRSAIMGKENSVPCRGPFENRWVGRLRQAHIPHVDHVQIWVPPR